MCFPSHIAEKPITTASQKTLTASGAHWTKIMISINDLDFVVRDPGGGGYSHTLPIRVCAAQRGRDFEAPDLERGIHFRGVL